MLGSYGVPGLASGIAVISGLTLGSGGGGVGASVGAKVDARVGVAVGVTVVLGGTAVQPAIMAINASARTSERVFFMRISS